MSEILDKLRTIVRRLELGGLQTSPGTVQQTMRDAVAEIERLRSSPACLAGLREAAAVARGLPYSPPGWPDDGVVRYRTCPTWAAAGKDGHWSVPPQLHSYGKGREDAASAILALAGETT